MAQYTQSSQRPNILLVMSDDQGWGDVGYNGYTQIKTPHTDALARDGVRLDRFYAAGPVCSPTRGSCMTGRHPYRYGIYWADVGSLPREEITLATALRTVGYRTGHFGKWHIGTLTDEGVDGTRGGARHPELYSPPWEHGFDVCFSTESLVPTYNPLVWGGGAWDATDSLDGSFKHIMDRPVRRGECPGTDDVNPWHVAYWEGPGQRVDTGIDGDDSEIIMDRCIEFIRRSAEGDDPFLGVVWFHTPHTPIAAGDRHRALYPNAPIEAQHFYGCISAMDEQIGRLRTELRSLEIADNTLLWFCSDNGPSYIHDFNSAGPFRGKKATLYEGGIRVPSIVEWPAELSGGRELSAPLGTSDFYPTITNLVGVEMAGQPPLDGEDVMSVLRGDCRRRERPIAFQSPVRGASSSMTSERQVALIDERFKALSLDDGKTYALYDLLEDASETKDVASDHTATVAEMRTQIDEWVASCAQSRSGADYA